MSPTFPKVLCPVDLSEPSRTALGYAASVADHFQAQLTILNVAGVDDADRQPFAPLKAFIEPVIRHVRLHPPPTSVVRSGVPHDVVLEIAAADRVDLIVMATHGLGATAARYGSTTLAVLRHSRTPLLVVPPALHGEPPAELERLLGSGRSILAPVDFHPRAVFDASVAAALAEAFGVPLVLFHAVAPDAGARLGDVETSLEDLRRQVHTPIAIRTSAVVGAAGPEVARFASECGAGLIVMGLRGSPGMPGSMPGSIAFDVLNRAPVLVLALPVPLVSQVQHVA